MKAVLDHIGIAVRDLDAALAFYRDALGLEVEASEEVASQRVRAHFVPVGASSLELLEATAADSTIARYVDQRGPGLHHITLRVDDIGAALAQLKSRGAKLIDEQPRPGAEGALVAFIHPSSAHGVLVELKQVKSLKPEVGSLRSENFRHSLGDLELVSLCDGSFRLDGGAIFGVVPKVLWAERYQADERNRVEIAVRQLLVRGRRTMLVDAGFGDKTDDAFRQNLALDRRRNLDHALADAGVAPEDIDTPAASRSAIRAAGCAPGSRERGTSSAAASGKTRPVPMPGPAAIICPTISCR
jgi:methylmalonyl-CoA epimerase